MSNELKAHLKYVHAKIIQIKSKKNYKDDISVKCIKSYKYKK